VLIRGDGCLGGGQGVSAVHGAVEPNELVDFVVLAKTTTGVIGSASRSTRHEKAPCAAVNSHLGGAEKSHSLAFRSRRASQCFSGEVVGNRRSGRLQDLGKGLKTGCQDGATPVPKIRPTLTRVTPWASPPPPPNRWSRDWGCRSSVRAAGMVR
jgi:hypothetical protein